MTMTTIPGGMWLPAINQGFGGTSFTGTASDALLLDADEEEVQIFGTLVLAGGPGTKTFSTATPSAISWLPGASITFADDGATDPILSIGLKKTTIDFTNGPPARATLAVAGFDVYRQLVGGTDTITSTTWRSDVMAAGSNTSCTHGDFICIAFHLDKPGAGAQSIKVRGGTPTVAVPNTPTATLVTSGPTYTATAVHPNLIITFSDGTIGWLEGAVVFTATSAATVGNGVIYANILQLPMDCQIDAVAAILNLNGTTTNADLGIWSDPLGTPASLKTMSIDAQAVSASAARMVQRTFDSQASISKNTNYAVGVKQNSATNITIGAYDVSAGAHFQANGLDANCYAATSTGGAAFSQLVSGTRRAAVWVRISAVDVPSSVAPMLSGMVVQ